MSETASQLTTTAADGRRLHVYPSAVSGRYRNRRNWISGLLLGVFLFLPWLKVGGHQAVLVDVWNGRLSLFGLHFGAHEAPLLLFLAAGAVCLLALVTAVWGRIWCGWACPQTVFVDLVFRRIENLIEGDAVSRRRLDQSPWNQDKVFKKAVKWGIFLFVALNLSHCFLAYWIGTEKLAAMVTHGPLSNPGSFLAMLGITAVILFDFGWFREQFCTLLCPYGRFQSVLMDERSMAVTYDAARGEPRGKTTAANAGDCVDCGKCVRVCPTGIDIRNGLQLECIACTACVDACDSVMERLHRPLGLIRLSSGAQSSPSAKNNWSAYLRPAAYLAVLIAIGLGLGVALKNRQPVQLQVVRATGAPYQELALANHEKQIVNFFRLEVMNQTLEPIELEMGANRNLERRGMRVVSAALPLRLAPGDTQRLDLFVQFPISVLREGHAMAQLEVVTSKKFMAPILQEVRLVGPLR